VKSSKSQNQTFMTLRMDDRTNKHSAKGLKTDAQRTTANISVGELRNFFLVSSFLFFLSLKNEEE
jgi:hypothetical protein